MSGTALEKKLDKLVENYSIKLQKQLDNIEKDDTPHTSEKLKYLYDFREALSDYQENTGNPQRLDRLLEKSALLYALLAQVPHVGTGNKVKSTIKTLFNNLIPIKDISTSAQLVKDFIGEVNKLTGRNTLKPPSSTNRVK